MVSSTLAFDCEVTSGQYHILIAHAINRVCHATHRLEQPLLSYGPINTLHFSVKSIKFYNVIFFVHFNVRLGLINTDYKNLLISTCYNYNTHIQRG